MSDETGDVHAAVAEALNTVLGDEGEMLIKWVVIAESMGGDGERGLWAMASADMKSYETLGFLEYAKAREYARRIAEHGDDD